MNNGLIVCYYRLIVLSPPTFRDLSIVSTGRHLELDKSHLASFVPFPRQSQPLEISHGLLLRRRSVVHATSSLWYLSAFSILILVIPTHRPLFRLNHASHCFVNFIIEKRKNIPTDLPSRFISCDVFI